MNAPRIVLSGYYGFGNAGDEAVCYAIIEALRREMPEVRITVLSNEPERTAEAYGVRAVNRWMPTRVLPQLASADLLISGGGSLLQDVTGANGILYYLGILEAARRLGVPQMIYAQGIGPLGLPRNRRLVARAMNAASLCTVREPDSKALLQKIGVQRPIFITPDPVIGLDMAAVDPALGERALRSAGRHSERPLLLCVPRLWGETDRVKRYAEALDRISEAEGMDVALLAMQPSQEGALCQAVAGHMKSRAVVLAEDYEMPTLLSIFKAADAVIAVRLHGLILGALAGARLLALSYDPKCRSFMDLVGCRAVLDIEDLTVEALIQTMAEATAPDPARIADLQGYARLPAKLAKHLLLPASPLVSHGGNR